MLGMRHPGIGTHLVAGYLVVGLDYFEGDSMVQHPNRDEFDYVAWRTRKQERAAILIPPWVEAIRKDYGKSSCACLVHFDQ